MAFQNPLKPSISWELFHQPEVLLDEAHFKTFGGHKLHYVQPLHHKTCLGCFLCVKRHLSISHGLHRRGNPSSAATLFYWTWASDLVQSRGRLPPDSTSFQPFSPLWTQWLCSSKSSLLVTMSLFHLEISDDYVFLPSWYNFKKINIFSAIPVWSYKFQDGMDYFFSSSLLQCLALCLYMVGIL